MELLPLSYRDSRRGSLCSCLKLTSMCFDRYHDYSIKSSSRSARATTSRVHHLTLTTPLPAQELHQRGTAERAYLWSSAKWEWHPVQFSAESQVSCYRGQVCLKKAPHVDLSSTREEADICLTQEAIHVAKEDPESRVLVVSDDTDVFALLL